MIILNRLQANIVRGLVDPAHALVPMPLSNRQFALPEAVLDDPAYAKFHDFLARLPTNPSIRLGTWQGDTLIDTDFEQDPVRKRRFAFSRDWKVGDAIAIDDTP